MSYALRHAPWEYELELDKEGWVLIKQLLKALKYSDDWEDLTRQDLEIMIEVSEKKRHEINSDRIRALYGHSVPKKIIKKENKPPKFLYHGTSRASLDSIMKKGLLPMSRQYVHLSQDIEIALQVGKRKDSQPTILLIDSEKAYDRGIKFYLGNEMVWLADCIPLEYISNSAN